jgi:hypothetical protein
MSAQVQASTPAPAYPARTQPSHQQAYTAPTVQHADDDALSNELAMSLDDMGSYDATDASPARTTQPQSLDDEMTRLLGELSSHKRQ